MSEWEDELGGYEGYLDPSGRAQDFVSSLLGDSGWDILEGSGSALCSGELSDFKAAINSLRYQLETERLRANTDAQIAALARMNSERWARYVDPDLSRGVSSKRLRSLVVLYECGEHICTLTQADQTGYWEAFMGPEAMYALRISPHLLLPTDDPASPEVTEPDVFDAPLPSLADDLTPEDEEYRDLRLSSGNNVDPEFRDSVFAAFGIASPSDLDGDAGEPRLDGVQVAEERSSQDLPRCSRHGDPSCSTCWWEPLLGSD